MVDLGTLADTGYPKYLSHNSSYASGTNNSGTLIVGWSGVDGAQDVPVVWSSSQRWNNGRFVTKWQIHALDTRGFPNHLEWQPQAVNDQRQIAALVFNQDGTFLTSVLWNPRADGEGWKPMTLPSDSSGYPYAYPFGINDEGDIVGVVLAGGDWLPRSRLWKPLNSPKTKYSQPIALKMPAGFDYCETATINNLGDIVGDCWDALYTKDLPVRWSTKRLADVELIGFPADQGFPVGINNFGIVAITYLGENCSSEMYGSCGGAIQLH